jgi:hypothetical protein
MKKTIDRYFKVCDKNRYIDGKNQIKKGDKKNGKNRKNNRKNN